MGAKFERLALGLRPRKYTALCEARTLPSRCTTTPTNYLFESCGTQNEIIVLPHGLCIWYYYYFIVLFPLMLIFVSLPNIFNIFCVTCEKSIMMMMMLLLFCTSKKYWERERVRNKNIYISFACNAGLKERDEELLLYLKPCNITMRTACQYNCYTSKGDHHLLISLRTVSTREILY